MSVRVDGSVVFLEGESRIEDADALLQSLLSNSRLSVNLSLCRSLHAAPAQILLAFQPPVVGVPENAFLSQTVVPALARGRGRPSVHNRGQGRPDSL